VDWPWYLEELFSRKLNAGVEGNRIDDRIHTGLGARMKDGWSGVVWIGIFNGKRDFIGVQDILPSRRLLVTVPTINHYVLAFSFFLICNEYESDSE
jgi:hypothetical protein